MDKYKWTTTKKGINGGKKCTHTHTHCLSCEESILIRSLRRNSPKQATQNTSSKKEASDKNGQNNGGVKGRLYIIQTLSTKLFLKNIYVYFSPTQGADLNLVQ